MITFLFALGAIWLADWYVYLFVYKIRGGWWCWMGIKSKNLIATRKFLNLHFIGHQISIQSRSTKTRQRRSETTISLPSLHYSHTRITSCNLPRDLLRWDTIAAAVPVILVGWSLYPLTAARPNNALENYTWSRPWPHPWTSSLSELALDY